MKPPPDVLVTIDIGGTLGTVDGPTLAAILANASPLEPAAARSVMRERLHTKPAITDTVIDDICASLLIGTDAFPPSVAAQPLRVLPGVLEALQQMSASATLVTLSNVTCMEVGTDQIREMFSPWISGHFPSCELGFAKPDPRAYETVAAAFGLATTEILHIGDDWQCDIVGATMAGAQAIWISHGRPVPDDPGLVESNVVVVEDLLAASTHVRDFATRRH